MLKNPHNILQYELCIFRTRQNTAKNLSGKDFSVSPVGVKPMDGLNKNRSLYIINEGFEGIFNAELMERRILGQPPSLLDDQDSALP